MNQKQDTGRPFLKTVCATVLWFRNVILQFSASSETMSLWLTPSSPSPVVGWRGESEAQEVRITGWGEWFTGNSNEIWEGPVTAATPVTERTRKMWTIHMETTIPQCSLYHTKLSWKGPLLPGRDSLPPDPSNEVRWYRITSGSWRCPLPDTAKTNPSCPELGQTAVILQGG